jgi:hypothetical protein
MSPRAVVLEIWRPRDDCYPQATHRLNAARRKNVNIESQGIEQEEIDRVAERPGRVAARIEGT